MPSVRDEAFTPRTTSYSSGVLDRGKDRVESEPGCSIQERELTLKNGITYLWAGSI